MFILKQIFKALLLTWVLIELDRVAYFCRISLFFWLWIRFNNSVYKVKSDIAPDIILIGVQPLECFTIDQDRKEVEMHIFKLNLPQQINILFLLHGVESVTITSNHLNDEKCDIKSEEPSYHEWYYPTKDCLVDLSLVIVTERNIVSK